MHKYNDTKQFYNLALSALPKAYLNLVNTCLQYWIKFLQPSTAHNKKNCSYPNNVTMLRAKGALQSTTRGMKLR